jgi:hypothetical protein
MIMIRSLILWKGYQRRFWRCPALGLALDVNRVCFENAGKKVARTILALRGKLLATLSAAPQTAEQVTSRLGAPDDVEAVYLLLEHLSANGRARSTGRGGPEQIAFSKC